MGERRARGDNMTDIKDPKIYVEGKVDNPWVIGNAYAEYVNLNPQTLYFYGMKYRGFSPSCQPMKDLYMILGEDDKYYNTLAYTRKLSEEEETKYELTYLGAK